MDAYLIVDPDSRNITIPEIESAFGVYGDNNAERKYFKSPRIVGNGIDLTECYLYVNYISASTKIGQILCDVGDAPNGTATEDEIVFSWPITRNVLDKNVSGEIFFAVQAKTKTGDTVFTTRKAKGNCYESIEGTETVAEEYADIILQLISRMDKVEENIGLEVDNYFKENPVVTSEYLTQTLQPVKDDVSSIKGDLRNKEQAIVSICNLVNVNITQEINSWKLGYVDGNGIYYESETAGCTTVNEFAFDNDFKIDLLDKKYKIAVAKYDSGKYIGGRGVDYTSETIKGILFEKKYSYRFILKKADDSKFVSVPMNINDFLIVYVPTSNTIKNNLSGKTNYESVKFTSFGDSVTALGGWQKQVVANLGMSLANYTNCGIGGTKAAGTNADSMWQDARINAIPQVSTLITFMAGINDWNNGVDIGDISIENEDTLTYVGALNVIAKKLLAKFPEARIVWMSPTWCSSEYNTSDKYWGKNAWTNWDGVTICAFRDAMRQISSLYGFAFIDLLGEMGVNQYNMDYFMLENEAQSTVQPKHHHPNKKGYERMIKIITAKLRNI